MDYSIWYSKNQCPQMPEEASEMCHIPYQEALRSLMYCAVATQPNISFAVGLLAQFMENPGRVHWEGVKRIFCYLLGMKGWKLTYGSNARGLEGYTDADGSTQEHQCAILGYTFLMNGGMISWSSKKQELITLSTAESEYVAATHAAKEVLWLCWLIGEIYQPLTHLIPLYSDLHSVITLTQDGSYHTCTKHIDIRYHFIRFIIQNGSINLIYCPTNNMAADMLTKLLLNIKAKHFAQSLGLQPS